MVGEYMKVKMEKYLKENMKKVEQVGMENILI